MREVYNTVVTAVTVDFLTEELDMSNENECSMLKGKCRRGAVGPRGEGTPCRGRGKAWEF